MPYKNREDKLRNLREYYMKIMETDPQGRREANRKAVDAYKAKNPNAQRRLDLRRRFGLTLDEYDAMVRAQDGKCAICGETPEGNLAVDHCHKTGRNRGLLCISCNVGIGRLRDDVSRVFAAAAYLLEYEDALEEMGIS